MNEDALARLKLLIAAVREQRLSDIVDATAQSLSEEQQLLLLAFGDSLSGSGPSIELMSAEKRRVLVAAIDRLRPRLLHGKNIQ
jgi:hypothetical protein